MTTMTYLQLCQRAAMECDISGAGPTTVAGNTGELNRICTWVAQAWTDLETSHEDWGWMLKDMSFVTVNGQAEYTPAQCGITALAWDFGVWVRNRFRNYVTAVGTDSEVIMDSDCTYDGWRNNYNYGATRNTRTRPLVVAIHPNQQNLLLGPYPTGDYTVTGQYYRAPMPLVDEADVPDIPEQFQMAIVYMAMISYGSYESAPEVLSRGETKLAQIMQKLDLSRLPDVGFG
jgi:hypothetical protein